MKLPIYRRDTFIIRMRELLDDMEEDHEACTGIGPNEIGTFEFWVNELQNAEDNRD